MSRSCRRLRMPVKEEKERMSKANREYKSSMFGDLFNKEESALELYNALTGSRFTLSDGLRFTTLNDALFMGRLNDVSFTVADKLICMAEHQSTPPGNVPLRDLLYIARVLEEIIDNRAIYRTKLLTIPTPEFYVLYNGVAKYPDDKTLRLSDAFRYVVSERPPALELIVRVININKGHNEKILEKCEVLRGYSAFIGKIREFQKAGSAREDAIAAAVDFCIANGILVEYLKQNSSEVRNMLFTEFNLEDAKEVWQEEAYEDGVEDGKLEDARAMFAYGDSIEKIASITKLPMETLKEKLVVQ
jgi:hypothetical protein